MPRTYPAEAIEGALHLFLKYNGQQHDRIEAEMRKRWPGWSKQNLYSRGEKIGWIDKYGWEEALKLHLATRPETALTSAERIFNETEEIRKRIYEEIKTLGAKADRDLIYQHRDYVKLSIDALSKLNGVGHTLEGFVAFWERLLDWLPELSEKALSELLKVADQVIEKATAVYGNQEETTGSGSASR